MNEYIMSPRGIDAKNEFSQLVSTDVVFAQAKMLLILACVSIEDSHLTGMANNGIITPRKIEGEKAYSPDNVRIAYLVMKKRAEYQSRFNMQKVKWATLSSEVGKLSRRSNELFFDVEEGQAIIALMRQNAPIVR